MKVVGEPKVLSWGGEIWVTTSTPISMAVWDEGCEGGVGIHDAWYEIWYLGDMIETGPIHTLVNFMEE